MKDNQAAILTQKNPNKLQETLNFAEIVINRSYLERLDKLQAAAPSFEVSDIDPSECGSFFDIKKLVTNADENFLDKMTTAVNAVTPLSCTVAAIIHSDGAEIRYSLGVIQKKARQDNSKDKALRRACADTFAGAMRGNFSGSDIRAIPPDEVRRFCDTIIGGARSVVSVSSVVSLRGEDNRNIKSYVQGLENLVDGLAGKAYTIVVIADAVDGAVIRSHRQGYEKLYTELSRFRELSVTDSRSESVNVSEATAEGISNSISDGITLTQSRSSSTSHTDGSSWGRNSSFGSSLFIANASLGKNYGNNASDTYGAAESGAYAVSRGDTNTSSASRTASKGSGREQGKSYQFGIEDRTVTGLLERIDRHLERLDQAESYGAFQCAAYVLAGTEADAISAAGYYNALTCGDSSFAQSSHINVWTPSPYQQKMDSGRGAAQDQASLVLKYLRGFSHPEFWLEEETGWKVCPHALIDGQRLAIQLVMPKKSIHGVTVLGMAPFGRNISRPRAGALDMGGLVYMGAKDSGGARVEIDAGKMTAHTFITGSTGSGKSNAIFLTLDKLRGLGVKFMVIEPAKGEYKNVFGHYEDVSVFGTNPKKTRLLRINPFRFPPDVHVLEHLDRLVELFNVCWPMYAAMPAILKDAMERAYAVSGWNLRSSENKYGEVFPVFADLLEQIETVIDESKYSADSKGDYSGALMTRVRSLTTGINSMIFCADDIAGEELFDKNVIADLSRVGSTETKALIMGLLVMKLHEYRASSTAGPNLELRHITVLEEAHNILKRTSAEQVSEGANLLGKSVELLANSIAEMRAYGEGFIIADQSPGLLDMSVIRNTNTKIILRLPDQGDRELVGRAASLNDEQISELSRLERGVAAIYQNEWIEPVLVKIDKCSIEEKLYKFDASGNDIDETLVKRDLLYLLIQGRVNERLDFDINVLERQLPRLNLPAADRILLVKLFMEYRELGELKIWKAEKFAPLSKLVSDILGKSADVEKEVLASMDNRELSARLSEIVSETIPGVSAGASLALSHCMLKNFSASRNDICGENIYKAWTEEARSAAL